MVIPSFAIFIDSAAKSMFMTHKAVIFIGCVGLEIIKERKQYSCHSQPGDDMFLNYPQRTAPFQLNG
jgi:hypothetical protein